MTNLKTLALQRLRSQLHAWPVVGSLMAFEKCTPRKPICEICRVRPTVHQSYEDSRDRKGIRSYSFTSFCEQCWQKRETARRDREEKEKKILASYSSVILHSLRLRIFMNVTQIYATAAGGFFFVFVIVNLLLRTARFREWISLLTSKYLTYPYFLNRHRLLGPWSGTDVLVQLIYIAINVFCLSFRVSTISKAGLQAGNLSLVNMIPLFAGAHLSFLADLLGFPLDAYRRVHRSAGSMTFALILFHILIVVINRTSFSLGVSEHQD
jgi:hypothetical protein